MSRTEQLMTLLTGDEKHSAAATSTLDVLRVLYERVLKVSPESVGDRSRDRFYLSKGHGPMAYYAVLAEQGYFPESWLTDWGSYDSPLGFHPDRNLVPGVEIGSGSLGHGLPLAVGTALGLRAQGVSSRVVVLVGDAELDEGSNHEALELAAAYFLDALTVVVIDNTLVDVRRAGTDRAAVRHRGLARGHRGRPRPRRPREGAVAPRVRSPQRRRRHRGGEVLMDARTQFARTAADLVATDESVALVYAEISGQFFGGGRARAPRSGGQRRHPRAAARQRRRRDGAHRDAADRAHVRLVPGRAGLRAGQARVRAPGRRAACSSVPAARSTSPRAAAPTSRRETSHCWTRCPASPSTPPATRRRSTSPCAPTVGGSGLHYVRVVGQANQRRAPVHAGPVPRGPARGGGDRDRLRAGAGRRPRRHPRPRRDGALRQHGPPVRRRGSAGGARHPGRRAGGAVAGGYVGPRTSPRRCRTVRTGCSPSAYPASSTGTTASPRSTSPPTASTPPASLARWRRSSARPRPPRPLVTHRSHYFAAVWTAAKSSER